MVQYQGRDFSIFHPDNWKPLTGKDSAGVTLAPPSAVQATQSGQAVGYGAVIGYYQPRTAKADLRRATEELAGVLKAADPRLRPGREEPREITFGGKRAIVTTLNSESIFQGQTEVDLLVTLPHPDGIFYIVFVTPESESQYANRVYEQMLESMRFSF